MDVVQQEAESLGKVAVPVPVAVAAQLSKSVCEGDNSNSAGHQVTPNSAQFKTQQATAVQLTHAYV